MKLASAAFTLSMLIVPAGGAEPEKPDPKTACLPLVGTYAEPDDPKDPEFTVAVADGKFSFVEARGKRKYEVTPTTEGLLVVGVDRDRSAHRLWYDTQRKGYWFGYLGKVREDRPLPKEPSFRKRLIKIESPPVKEKEAEKKP